MIRALRKWVAWKLVQIAARLYDGEHRERFEIHDEYGISRFAVEFLGDEYGCTTTSAAANLPRGWEWTATIDGALGESPFQ